MKFTDLRDVRRRLDKGAWCYDCEEPVTEMLAEIEFLRSVIVLALISVDSGQRVRDIFAAAAVDHNSLLAAHREGK
jgi:hypothetical protein